MMGVSSKPEDNVSLKSNKTGRTLSHNKADIEAKNIEGKSILMLAVQEGHIDTVKILLSAGAQVNAIDHEGKTALILAALNGHKETVGILLDKGVDVDFKDKRGLTAMGWAILKRHRDTVKVLQDWSNKVSLEETNGKSNPEKTGNKIDPPPALPEHNNCAGAKGGDDGSSLRVAPLKGYIDIEQALQNKHAHLNVKSKNKSATYIGRVNSDEGKSYAVIWDRSERDVYIACPNLIFVGKAPSLDEAIELADKWLNTEITRILSLSKTRLC